MELPNLLLDSYLVSVPDMPEQSMESLRERIRRLGSSEYGRLNEPRV